MQRFIFACLGVAWSVSGAELKFDFRDTPVNQSPPGFRSTLSGEGRAGEWKVVLDEVPSAFPTVFNKTPTVSQRPVLAQVSRDPADDRYPLLVLTNETFADFTLTTKLKIVSGEAEQMAGIAFRMQDEKNYYYVRASVLGKNLAWFKWENGQLIGPIGLKIDDLQTNVWYELSLDCHGNEIRCSLNGTNTLRIVRDSAYPAGQIGFWTKSDSVSYFADTRILYIPKEIRAKRLVRETMEAYGRLEGVMIYGKATNDPAPRLLAGTNTVSVPEPAITNLQSVLSKGTVYYLKENEVTAMTLPLHDVNGERVAIARVIMKSFPGQTEKNALERAVPIIKFLEARFQRSSDLFE
jgi:hypothetical protein